MTKLASALLGATAVIFRADTLVLIVPIVLIELRFFRLSFFKGFTVGFVSCALSLGSPPFPSPFPSLLPLAFLAPS